MTDYEKKLMRDFGLDAPDTSPRDPGRPAMSDVTELVKRLENPGQYAPSVLEPLMLKAAAALTAQAAEIERLREALAPFAREAALWPDYVPDADGLFIASPDDIEPILQEYASSEGRASAGVSYSNDVVTVGDLRRAAAAIRGGQP